MITPTRELWKRNLDIADFTLIVAHSLEDGEQPIDLEKLENLGEKVWKGGGGDEVIHLIGLVKAGRQIILDQMVKLPKKRKGHA